MRRCWGARRRSRLCQWGREPAEAVEGERQWGGGGGGAEEEGEREREDERDGDESGEERAGQAPREPRHGRRERCSGDVARSPRRRRTMRRARGWIRRARAGARRGWVDGARCARRFDSGLFRCHQCQSVVRARGPFSSAAHFLVGPWLWAVAWPTRKPFGPSGFELGLEKMLPNGSGRCHAVSTRHILLAACRSPCWSRAHGLL